jgi:hypothetical protein
MIAAREQGMARWVMVAMLVLATAPASGGARADATLACNFSGKSVQALVTNSNDGPRSCNAVCTWRYANVPFRGTGGAQLEAGEAKTAYRGTAPYPITSVYSKDLTCDR